MRLTDWIPHRQRAAATAPHVSPHPLQPLRPDSSVCSYIVASVLAIAALKLFFHTKSEEADFLYLKEQGKKEAVKNLPSAAADGKPSLPGDHNSQKKQM
jgi:hypothetical protein